MSAVRTIVVGCGEPKKSMGWFHLQQLAVNPKAELLAVVEPWFLGGGAGSRGAAEFEAMRAELARTHPGCKFAASVAEVAVPSDGSPVLALVAGRTCDAPSIFDALCAKGVTHIYLEKPGADSAARLEAMRQKAKEHGVAVLVGYNKNVAQYMSEALAALAARDWMAQPAPLVTLEHCNAFKPGPELVEFLGGPGGEGMLHNMACHELALAATLFGVSVERVASVSLQPELCEIVYLDGGGADWSRVAFTLKLHPSDTAPVHPSVGVAPTRLRFVLDRCGGNFSRVHLEAPGAEAQVFRLPSAEHQAVVEEQEERDPEMRPYFFQQAPDYLALKAAFLEHIAAGRPGTPPGVVDLDGALAALRLADMLRPALLECWEAGAPYTWAPSA